MLESIFQFLFKYRPVVFERGELVFDGPWRVTVVLLLGAVVALPAIVSYLRVKKRLSTRDRILLAGLRVGAIAILVFCLSRPILIIATVVPQQNFLGILVDDSRSMQIADLDGRPRSDFVQEYFGAEGSELLDALSDKFKLRFFRFSETVQRFNDASELDFSGRRTDLGRALDHARLELAAVPFAGLIVLTDGAHNAEGGGRGALSETLLQLQASKVPVHVVGLGEERFANDVEISRVDAPRRVLNGSAVAADVIISQSGYDGRSVRLTVEDAGRIVTTQDVEFSGAGTVQTVRVHFKASEVGARLFRFSVAPFEDEIVRENNARAVLVIVEDTRKKILYFEGEPRWEVGFVRRAVAEDENLHVVTLVRTAENKFYRLDVEGPEDLAGGFPDTREALFEYDGLILGSVEASFFTPDQLRMIEEFVEVRGGGVLALGGRLAFGRGGYANTPVADMLPIVIEGSRSDTGTFFALLKVSPTPFGRSHPVTQLGGDPQSSEERWNDLPELSTLNLVRRVKPGASTLLTARSSAVSDPLVVLAYHRYGRGKAIAFAVQDLWIWQLHGDMPLDDLTHERLWQQLLRWLVDGVPDRVSVTTASDRVAPGSPVTVTAEVTDSGYIHVNGAAVMATITSPSGEEQQVPMEWTVVRDGEYMTTFVPEESGRHEIRVVARRGGGVVGTASASVEVGDLRAEAFDATMRAPLLRQIADETGGQFYTPDNVASLPEDVSFTESGMSIFEERDLWDMPIVFFALVTLIAAEWTYRRHRGLA